MSVAGPCEICLIRTVEHACDRCGSLVCGEHFDTETGYCLECATEIRGGRPQSSDEVDPEDTDTYQF